MTENNSLNFLAFNDKLLLLFLYATMEVKPAKGFKAK